MITVLVHGAVHVERKAMAVFHIPIITQIEVSYKTTVVSGVIRHITHGLHHRRRPKRIPDIRLIVEFYGQASP